MDKKIVKQEVKDIAKKKAKKVIKKQEQKQPLNERQRLAKMSPYFASLMDPLNVSGAKIPDACMIPTGTAKLVQRVQVPIDSGGVCGILLCVGREYTFDGSTPEDYYVISSLSSAASRPPRLGKSKIGKSKEGGTQVKKIAVTPTPPSPLYYTGYTKSGGLQFQSNVDRARIVSACLYCTYQGSPLNAKGRFISMFCGGSTGQDLTPSSTALLLSQFPIINTYPASKGFCMSRYLPMDESSYLFSGVNPPSNTDSDAYGFCMIVLDGGNPGDVVEFTMVENFEFVPNSSVLNYVQATPSYNDPIELASVGNTISNDQFIAVQAPVKDILAGSPSSTPPQAMALQSADEHAKGSGFLDSFINGVSKAWDVGSKIAKEVPAIAAPILAML
jgi:hypothetical protein